MNPNPNRKIPNIKGSDHFRLHLASTVHPDAYKVDQSLPGFSTSGMFQGTAREIFVFGELMGILAAKQ